MVTFFSTDTCTAGSEVSGAGIDAVMEAGATGMIVGMGMVGATGESIILLDSTLFENIEGVTVAPSACIATSSISYDEVRPQLPPLKRHTHYI